MLSLLVGLLVFPTLQAVLLLLHHHWVNALKMARAQNEQATMPTNQRRLTILTLMAALVMAVEAIVYFYVFFKLLDILAALTMGPSAESVVWYFWYGVGLMHGFSGLVGFFLCVMWIAQMSVVLQSPLDYAWPASPSTCKVPGNLAYIDLEASSYSTLDPIEELNEMTPLIGGTLSNLDVTLPVEPLASVMDSSGPERRLVHSNSYPSNSIASTNCFDKQSNTISTLSRYPGGRHDI